MAAHLSRRGFVGGAAVLSTAALWAPRPSRAAIAMGFDEARHLLSRATFGATPAEIRTVEAMDYAAAIDKLLETSHANALTSAPIWTKEGPAELREAQKESLDKKGVDGKPLKIQRPVQEQARELRNWWVEEMLITDQPLVERMTLFWHNHFTSSLEKVKYLSLMLRQRNELFRREALGNFGRLLKSVARDPAMLIYLDGARSVARQPNENFARELLELFTLGEGHYTEADIKNAARAFTGWSIDRETGAFRVHEQSHDSRRQSIPWPDRDVHRRRYPRHPAETARAASWWSRSCGASSCRYGRSTCRGETPAAILRDGNYEMKPDAAAMFLSPAFRDLSTRGALIKSPVDLVVGSWSICSACQCRRRPSSCA